MDPQDHERFRDFVDARWGALLRLANLLTGGDRHEAEDLVQTALMKALGRWQHIEDPEGYVRKVMYRHQISRWRLRRPHREATFAAPPESFGVTDGTSAADLRITVRQALARLTPRQRTVLVLRYFEDLSETEAAGALGCSVGTIRSTTYRSLARLRTLAPELSSPAQTASTTPHNMSLKGARP
ncbi:MULTISPECIES: SigE family RNA polymerase sigma factor [unclassified Streptomyces]|jgi:RNA polymerase sigma-70 factor (sigma-E family)|uniref:SigE family RNA polymerase sigma factor n=1 Tax=unclassified Streptomyces TaxID=2593676 RepID=UPI0022503CD4|nr:MULTISPECIES: SigE family RNA polymerase sigma factor [unclassified Streptomyces]WSE11934.1 SigE family RNA polymerase sigma factor [Streptomyces sp. NBC_01397]MCX5443719.1 SigE family RNA polymerase sigma factor [Streptomyces sp. NBC_00063]WSE19692.1 SigE family RNA polymerase sigma factor [Streptomyces sp. NBC_01397]WUB90939.1 SigE family RNA polymerase sigma factor [Streptomyces sp. NBC_00569]WUB99100.1 SigE family RNA polymerase sigma factor [Streptomyces sp. NBC_00569]